MGKLMQVRGRGALIAAGVIATATLTFLPSPVGAADATGCSGKATSFDANGKQVDTVSAPGNGGTSGNPFEIDPEGTVKWEATATPAVPHGAGWTVGTQSTPKISYSGDGGLDTDSGTENMSDRLVVKVPLIGETRIVSGTFAVDITVGDTCTFSGYVKISGSPLGTPLFWGGMILGVGGLILALFATPTATSSAGAASGSAASAAPAPEAPASAPPTTPGAPASTPPTPPTE